MAGASEVFEWYYIGHYGQLGPLSEVQIVDLIRDGVIERETYLWRSGMPDWARARMVPQFEAVFTKFQISAPPPPPSPSAVAEPPMKPHPPNFSTPAAPITPQYSVPYGTHGFPSLSPYDALPVSDRNRVVAGILQLFLPGVGRMYLGFTVQGLLQFVLTFCMMLGYIWSLVDGFIILTGGVKLDGYGRRLKD